MKKILVLSASFYKRYEIMMLEGVKASLDRAGREYELISLPGCYEIPAALSMAIKNGGYAGFITLGCVIRGQTTHYDYVCGESSRGINQLAMDHNVAVGFGIITAETDEQAFARADIKEKNVGGRAAEACLAMIDLKEKMGV